MDDLISRQAAIETMKNMYHAAEKWGEEASDDVIKARAESCMVSLIEMKMRIEKLPSAQPEIVRCEYCNKSKEWPNGRWCSLFRASVNTDSYCSFGAKRKEGRKE